MKQTTFAQGSTPAKAADCYHSELRDAISRGVAERSFFAKESTASAVDGASAFGLRGARFEQPTNRGAQHVGGERLGEHLVGAEFKREGEAQVARREPDLVILDIFMPERDGFETLRSLRRTHPGLKILAISGSSGGLLERTLAFALEFGANAVLPKPFPADALRGAVRNLLEPGAREANG